MVMVPALCDVLGYAYSMANELGGGFTGESTRSEGLGWAGVG